MNRTHLFRHPRRQAGLPCSSTNRLVGFMRKLIPFNTGLPWGFTYGLDYFCWPTIVTPDVEKKRGTGPLEINILGISGSPVKNENVETFLGQDARISFIHTRCERRGSLSIKVEGSANRSKPTTHCPNASLSKNQKSLNLS